MRRIIAIIACLAGTSCFAHAEGEFQKPLQGVWFGIDSVERLVLVVQDDKWTFIHPTGAKESAFTIEKGTSDIHNISFDRFDGKKQVGIMRLEDARIVMKLSDPGISERPEKLQLAPDGQPFPGTYVFTRKVTRNGLMTLQVNIQNNPSMKLVSDQ